MRNDRDIVRVQLDLPAEKVEELEQIMAITGVATRKDLFENALTLFAWAVDQRKAGRILASIDECDEGYREVVMPALASIKREANHRNHFKKIKT